jgi:hypothetical protein
MDALSVDQIEPSFSYHESFRCEFGKYSRFGWASNLESAISRSHLGFNTTVTNLERGL